MAKRKLDETYMKQLLAEGLPYKPSAESGVSDLERQKALATIEGGSEIKKDKTEASTLSAVPEVKSRKASVKTQKRTIDKKVSEKEETEVPMQSICSIFSHHLKYTLKDKFCSNFVGFILRFLFAIYVVMGGGVVSVSFL